MMFVKALIEMTVKEVMIYEHSKSGFHIYTIKVGLLAEQNSPLDDTSCQRVADRSLRAWRHRQAQQATCLSASRLLSKAEVRFMPQSGL